MEVDREVTPAQSKKKSDKGESPPEKQDGKRSDKKTDAEDPKPRIVLTFRSEKQGAKSSTMKIVPTEEKPEEISPRRSIRTRTANKWDSDEDNDSPISPKKEKTSENEDIESHVPPKRSTPRRNKEFDNVIANAIARKVKSYNEASAPSRPSRRIKPTAKVLANEELRIGNESQNNSRIVGQSEKTVEEGVKTRRQIRGRTTAQEEAPKHERKETTMKEIAVTDADIQNENQVKKLKHLCELGLKAISLEDVEIKDEDVEEVESLHDEPEAIEIDDDDTEDNEDEEIDDDTEVISKLLEADAESVSTSDDEYLSGGKQQARPRRMAARRVSEYDTQSSIDDNAPLRRSSRKRHYQPDYVDEAVVPKQKARGKKLRSEATSEADLEEIGEPAGGDEGSVAACPEGDDSRVVATCLCEAVSTYYAAPAELTEPVFCQAIDSIDGVRVGCSHTAMKLRDGSYAPLARCGPRAPYVLACAAHARRLRAHMGCAACGLFCSQGKFYQCSSGHLFHLECGLPYNEGQAAPGCPHCGVTADRWLPANREAALVNLTMSHTNKTIFLPEQRVQCTPAYRTFSTLNPSQIDQAPMIPEDLLPSSPVDPKRLCEKPDLEEDPVDAAEALCEGILSGEAMEQLIPKIIAASNLNVSLPSLSGGTVVHAAARRGHLTALHLLHTAGADLNSTANLKTPLMLAVLTLLDKSESKSPKKGKMTSDKESTETEALDPGAKDHLDRQEKDADARESEADRPSDEELMKVIRYLVAAGCDVNVPGPDGMTALHMAAQLGGTAVCDVILGSVGAALDARDQGGWTPLVWAAENMHQRTVKYLLNAGADALSYDNEGNSVIHWCALAGASAPLRLLLDVAPQAANAPNRNTDTPLHVAAHQGHYACVIILLARGARTDLKNSEGELPMDVCEGPCRAAISLNMQMSLAVADKVTPQMILSNDISRGREAWPVPCVNEVDAAPLPADFTYVTAHVMAKVIPIDNTLESLQGCKCVDGDCSSAACECSLLGVRRWWARGRLAAGFPFHDPPMLFDCNATCGCNAKKCTNSVLTRLCSQGSIFIRATVFRKGGGLGWGLRADACVPRGAPVGTYVGELLEAGDADSRSADQYMFAMDVKPDLLEQWSEKTLLCVDAASYGGAARFINHSCRPNLAPVRAFTASRDLRLPVIALFANTDIGAGDELTFDYGDKFWSVKSKWMRCECGVDDCRYAKPTDTDA